MNNIMGVIIFIGFIAAILVAVLGTYLFATSPIWYAG